MVTKQGGPQKYAAMNCYFTMPFAQKGRITIVNQCDVDISSFYFHVDYEETESFPESILYFHAQWRRQNPTDGVLDMEELKKKHAEFDGPLKEISSVNVSAHFIGPPWQMHTASW